MPDPINEDLNRNDGEQSEPVNTEEQETESAAPDADTEESRIQTDIIERYGDAICVALNGDSPDLTMDMAAGFRGAGASTSDTESIYRIYCSGEQGEYTVYVVGPNASQRIKLADVFVFSDNPENVSYTGRTLSIVVGADYTRHTSSYMLYNQDPREILDGQLSRVLVYAVRDVVGVLPIRVLSSIIIHAAVIYGTYGENLFIRSTAEGYTKQLHTLYTEVCDMLFKHVKGGLGE